MRNSLVSVTGTFFGFAGRGIFGGGRTEQPRELDEVGKESCLCVLGFPRPLQILRPYPSTHQTPKNLPLSSLFPFQVNASLTLLGYRVPLSSFQPGSHI